MNFLSDKINKSNRTNLIVAVILIFWAIVALVLLPQQSLLFHIVPVITAGIFIRRYVKNRS